MSESTGGSVVCFHCFGYLRFAFTGGQQALPYPVPQEVSAVHDDLTDLQIISVLILITVLFWSGKVNIMSVGRFTFAE